MWRNEEGCDRILHVRSLSCLSLFTDQSCGDANSAKLKRTEAAIEEYRTEIDSRKAENYGFASMAAVPYAHVVAKMIEGKRPKGTAIDLAPNPKDIVRAIFCCMK